MQTFTIDCAKWVCGVGSGSDLHAAFVASSKRKGNWLGKRPSLLLNGRGYMCCLGQICEQMGVPKESLYAIGLPSALPAATMASLKGFLVREHGELSELSIRAAVINDDFETTVREKIDALTRLFAQHKINLEFINVPETIKETAL